MTQEFGPPSLGAPEPGQQGNREQMYSPEQAYMASQTAGYITEGSREISRFLEAMASGDVERIRKTVEEGEAYAEGLYLGANAERYDLSDDNVFLDVKDRFTSAGNSADRRDHTMLVRHMRDKLTNLAKDIGDYRLEREEWETEKRKEFTERRRSEAVARKLSISTTELNQIVENDLRFERARMEQLSAQEGTLVGLSLHVAARQEFDEVFRLRQQTAFSAENHISIIQNPRDREGNPITIETGDWKAVYQANSNKDPETGKQRISKFGDRVSVVEKEIIRKGQENRRLYVSDIMDDKEFKKWMEELLPLTAIDGKQRMDVLWTAWKMCLLKEEISRIAWYVDEDGQYAFSNNPVLTSDMGKVLQHSSKAQADEFGMDALLNEREAVDMDTEEVLDRRTMRVVRKMTSQDKENYFRRQTERQKASPETHKLSHSGHPLTLLRGWGQLGKAYQHRTNIEGWTGPDSNQRPEKKTLYQIWYEDDLSFADPRFPWQNPDRSVGDAGDDRVPPGSVSGWGLELKRGLSVRNNFVLKLPQPQDLGRQWFESIRDITKIKRVKPDQNFRGGKVREGSFPENPMASLAAAYLYYLSVNRQPYKDDIRGFMYQGFAGKLGTRYPNEPLAGVTDGDFIANMYKFGLVSQGEAEWLMINFTLLDNQDKFWKQYHKPGPPPIMPS